MLVIRKEQSDAFLKSQEEAFIMRMVNHLREDFSEEIAKKGIQENDLSPVIRKSMENAQKYDVIYESDMKLYIECIALLGIDFDVSEKNPRINEILNRKDLTGEEKMEQISDYLTYELS
jgi:hypothetical protein